MQCEIIKSNQIILRTYVLFKFNHKMFTVIEFKNKFILMRIENYNNITFSTWLLLLYKNYEKYKTKDTHEYLN